MAMDNSSNSDDIDDIIEDVLTSDDDMADESLGGYEGVEQNEKVSSGLFSSPHGIMVYNGKKYAVGLTWFTIDEGADPSITKKRARQLRADFSCVRSNISQQQGFGFLDKGHRMGMSVAAGMAADALIGEWHGVFKAENGWWYMGVHSDTIAPDGDIFFESEEEAYNHFTRQAESYRWPRTYAPEDWNVPNTSGEVLLEKLFHGMPATNLKPIGMTAMLGGSKNKNLAMTYAGLAGICFAVLFLAFRVLPNLLPENVEVPQQRLALPGRVVAPPKGPDEQGLNGLSLDNAVLPVPARVIETCLENFSDITISFPGWVLDKLRCANNRAEAVWLRGKTGTLDSLRPYIGQFPLGVSKSFSGRQNFVASRVIVEDRKATSQVTFMEREDALILLNERFGNLGQMKVEDLLPTVDPNEQRNQNPNEPKKITLKDLPSLRVELKTRTPPNLIKNYFNIPGLIIDVLEWDVGAKRWTYRSQVLLKYDPMLVSTNVNR